MKKIQKYIYLYRKWFGIGIGCFIMFLLLLFPFITKPKASSGEEEIILTEEKPVVLETPTVSDTHILVDVKGAVVAPGVYLLNENDRIRDAILQAGGVLENADLSCINLSKKATDEMVIIIYTKEEIENYKSKKEQPEYVYIEIPCECPDSMNDACIENEKIPSNSDKVSLNQATLEQLEKLPGIGGSKAQAIIEYRQKTPFQTIEELKEIKGIGDSVFEKLQAYITI